MDGVVCGLPRPVVDAVAGATAGAVARFAVGPLDLLKIRFQVQLETAKQGAKYTNVLQAARSIVQEEGVIGLWRGTLAAQLLVVPYTAVQFIVLQQFKRFSETTQLGKNPRIKPLVYPTMRDAAKGILKQRGVSGLYSGITPTLIEIIPYAGLQFGVYDTCQRLLQKTKRAVSSTLLRKDDQVQLSQFELFCCALVSGTLAKLAVHPLDVAKKRFQVAGLARSARYGAVVERDMYRNVLDCITTIYAKEGLGGLYKGAVPSLIKAAPAAAITLTVYEMIIGRWTLLCTNLNARKELDRPA
eukprot:jgi/Chlat1/4295/Chrsp29S04559